MRGMPQGGIGEAGEGMTDLTTHLATAVGVPGPWTIRSSSTGADYWHVEGPRQLRVAVCIDEATAAFIVGACNDAMEASRG